jgi:hypothetical protein
MKQKTAITHAIKHIAEVREKMTSSSQILGLTQAMDILEGYKDLEKLQIEKAVIFGNRQEFYDGTEEIGNNYFNSTYTQSSE